MQTIIQNTTYLLIGALVFGILWLITPSHPFKPTGIILPITQQAYPPTTLPVNLFETTPMQAKLLAYINVEGHSNRQTLIEEDTMIRTAKQMAQQIGANGLVINTFGYEGKSENNPAQLAKYIIFGTAIQIPRVSQPHADH